MSRAAKELHNRENLIVAMLSQPSLEKAAAAAGISPTTAWRISKAPEFQDEFKEASRKVHEEALLRLQSKAGAAVDTVLSLMHDPSVPSAVRLRACSLVLEHANSASQSQNVGPRMSRIEEGMKLLEESLVKRAA